MDEVEFIHRVLSRLNLPDQEVYPALARTRDARRKADKPEIHKVSRSSPWSSQPPSAKAWTGRQPAGTSGVFWPTSASCALTPRCGICWTIWWPTAPTATAGCHLPVRWTMEAWPQGPVTSRHPHGLVGAINNDRPVPDKTPSVLPLNDSA